MNQTCARQSAGRLAPHVECSYRTPQESVWHRLATKNPCHRSSLTKAPRIVTTGLVTRIGSPSATRVIGRPGRDAAGPVHAAFVARVAASRRHNAGMDHPGSDECRRGLMTKLAGGRDRNVHGRLPFGRRAVVTGRTARCDAGMAERGAREGGRRSVARIAGGRRGHMGRRFAPSNGPVMAVRARRGRHHSMVHRGWPPACGPVATVAGNGRAGTALVVGWNPRRRHPMTGLTGPRRYSRVIEGRRYPRCRVVTGVTRARSQAAFVTGRNPSGQRVVVTG